MATDGETATSQQVTLPQLGESVSEGVIVMWLVGPGDDIEVDDPIAEISTDKVDTEIPSPVAGTVVRHLAEVDAVVEVGQPILEVTTQGDGGAPPDQGGPGPTDPPGGAAATSPPAAGSTSTEPPASGSAGAGSSHAAAEAGPGSAGPAAERRDTSGAQPGPGDRLSPKVRRLLGEHGLDPQNIRGTGSDGRITPDDVQRAARDHRGGGSDWRGLRLSPLVRRLLRDHGVDPHHLDGTGTGGRITPDDVRTAARVREEAPAAAVQDSRATHAAGETAARAPASTAAADDRSTVEPLSRTRKIIAERMLASLQTTAQLTAAVEADVTRIMHTRGRLRDAAKRRYGFAPSPLAFIIKATCRALQRHPVINASIDTDAGTATYHGFVNLGVAVDTPNGLMVPVIRDAHELGVMALQQRVNDLAARARDRKLRPDDLQGGTFTITNTGSGGTLFDTPILNPPEAAILATPKIEKRPVVVTDDAGNDQIAIRHRTYLCLSYDHRLIDGADAARFLTDLATQLDETDWEQELGELVG